MSRLKEIHTLIDHWPEGYTGHVPRYVVLLKHVLDLLAKSELEVCVCAAWKLTDGSIMRGHRHSHCFLACPVDRRERMTQEGQGFMTTRNRFVGREEGARLQNAAGILSVWTGKPINGVLFSEDLY